MIFESQTKPKCIVTRGISLFLSVFILLSIIGGLCFPNFNTLRWILHISFIPEIVLLIFLGFLGVYMMTFAIQPRMRENRKSSLTLFIYIYGILLLTNSAEYYFLLIRGKINTTLPIPFTLILLIVIMLMTLRIRKIKPEKDSPIRNNLLSGLQKALFFIDFMPLHLHINVFASKKTDRKMKSVANSVVKETLTPKNSESKLLTAFMILIVFMISAFLFTLGQMFCYGNTNYIRKVDVVVVLGASVHVDGTMSLVLEDRIRSACEVYKISNAKYLICSGGPGPGKISEAQAMKSFAITQGIDSSKIIVDDCGLNTFETVNNLKRFMKENKLKTVIAVSHFYHLTRIKLTCESFDIKAFTVSATETRTPSGIPFFVVREVFALWYYFFKIMITKAT